MGLCLGPCGNPRGGGGFLGGEIRPARTLRGSGARTPCCSAGLGCGSPRMRPLSNMRIHMNLYIYIYVYLFMYLYMYIGFNTCVCMYVYEYV